MIPPLIPPLRLKTTQWRSNAVDGAAAVNLGAIAADLPVNAEKGKTTINPQWTGLGAPSESAVIDDVDDFGGPDVAADSGAIAAGLVAEGFAAVWCNAAML